MLTLELPRLEVILCFTVLGIEWRLDLPIACCALELCSFLSEFLVAQYRDGVCSCKWLSGQHRSAQVWSNRLNFAFLLPVFTDF